MDLKKTGNLIAARRKELGLTQKELAERLQVTDKAISRWETGKGLPETSLLQPLANILGISITEIVNGERTRPEEAARQADDALLAAMRYGKRMASPVTGVLLLICGTILALAPLAVTGISPLLLWSISGVTYVWGILQFWNKWPSARVARIVALILLTAALVLQTLPGSAVLIFAGPDYRNVEYYSCFDLMIVGYGMFMPFLSGVLTAITVLLMMIGLAARKRGLQSKVFVCTIVSAVFMLLPILMSPEYVTLMGYFVILLLALSAVFQARGNEDT